MFFKYIFILFIIFLMLFINFMTSVRSAYLLRPSVRYLPGGIPILLQKTLEK